MEQRSGVLSYRELDVWKKAFEAAVRVYRLAPRLPKEETYGMRSQWTRAATSVPANIAEGWLRESNREKAHFMSIAQGSLAETETLLAICEEVGWFSTTETSGIRALHADVGKMLSAMRRKYREANS